MSTTQVETLTQSTHAAVCNAAEGTRQSACAAASPNQATVRAAEVVYYRACRASAIAAGQQSSVFLQALSDLGQPNG